MTVLSSRPLNMDDFQGFYDLNKLHYEEMKHLPHSCDFNERRAEETVALLLSCKRENSREIYGLFCEGSLVGFIWVAYVVPHYSTIGYATEVYTFIKKENRCGKGLSILIDKAKEFAEDVGANVLQLGITSDNPDLERAYKKRYKHVGSIYSIDLRS